VNLPVPYTGIMGVTVTDVSQRLLAQHGGLRRCRASRRR
jgi:hypothetical protein